MQLSFFKNEKHHLPTTLNFYKNSPPVQNLIRGFIQSDSAHHCRLRESTKHQLEHTVSILAFWTARITLNDKHKEIRDPEITIPRRHLGQCQENRHKLKVLKANKIERRKEKARKLICAIPYYLYITIYSGQHSGWL